MNSFKVVYNSCYGGFGLSNEAMDRMVELGYTGFELNPEYNPNSDNTYKVKHFNELKYFNEYSIPRHHPILVQVVEELGERANGCHADLQIAVVNEPYRIDEYDGCESVETVSSYDWIVPEIPSEDLDTIQYQLFLKNATLEELWADTLTKNTQEKIS